MKKVYIGTCLYFDKSCHRAMGKNLGLLRLLFILHNIKTQAFSLSTDGSLIKREKAILCLVVKFSSLQRMMNAVKA